MDRESESVLVGCSSSRGDAAPTMRAPVASYARHVRVYREDRAARAFLSDGLYGGSCVSGGTMRGVPAPLLP